MLFRKEPVRSRANTMGMTRKFDPNLGQYRDSGKFDGNDNQPAAGGMNALESQVEPAVDVNALLSMSEGEREKFFEEMLKNQPPPGPEPTHDSPYVAEEHSGGTYFHAADNYHAIGAWDHVTKGLSFFDQTTKSYENAGKATSAQDAERQLRDRKSDEKYRPGNTEALEHALAQTHPPSKLPDVAAEQANMLERTARWARKNNEEFIEAILSPPPGMSPEDRKELRTALSEGIKRNNRISDVASGRAAWIRNNVLGEKLWVSPKNWKYGNLEEEDR